MYLRSKWKPLEHTLTHEYNSANALWTIWRTRRAYRGLIKMARRQVALQHYSESFNRSWHGRSNFLSLPSDHAFCCFGAHALTCFPISSTTKLNYQHKKIIKEIHEKACQLELPHYFLTDFTDFLIWGSMLLDFGFITKDALCLYRHLKVGVTILSKCVI